MPDNFDFLDYFADGFTSRRLSNLVMLLVRVNLGRVICLEGDNTMPPGVHCDTAVGGTTKRFREFMVFNSKRLYPEFLICYDRIGKK